MITFKQFLTEAPVKLTQDNPRISAEDFKVIVSTAKAMIRGGYADNYLKMVEMKEFLVRGSDHTAYRMGDHAVKTGKMVLGIVEPKRTKDRLSTFSDNQFIYNVWHLLGMPSRKRCIMATVDTQMSGEFGTPFIFVPKEGTVITYTEEDWNVGFKEEVAEVFGERIRFGNLSYVFRAFGQLGRSKYYSNFEPFRTTLVTNLSKLKELCAELDTVLKNTPEGDLSSIREASNHMRCIRSIWNLVQHEGKETFELLSELMLTIKAKVYTTTNVDEVLRNLSSKRAEVWWTGDSFALRVKYYEELKELENVLKQLMGR